MYGQQILISIFLLQGFLFSDAFAMPRDDTLKLPDAVYDFCGKDSSTCLGGFKHADNNCFQAQNCTTIVAFEKVDGTYVFQTLTHLSADVAYVALGLSNDTSMGDDGVVECIQDNKGDSSVNVYLAYTTKDPYDSIRLKEQKGINPMVAKVDGEFIYCQFNLTNSLDFEKFKVSLDGENEYYLFGAAGAARKDENDNVIGVQGHKLSSLKSEEAYFKTSGSSSVAACFSLVSILLLWTKFY